MKKIVTGYADDVAAMAEWPSQNQKVINAMEEWLEWSETMAAKPRKCLATAMEEGQEKDPLFTIAGTFMKWIANSPFKFLGKQVCTDGSDKDAKKLLMQKFEEYVTKIDETLRQKMWTFDKVLMSKISWDFLVHDSLICGRFSSNPDKDVQEMD